MKAEEYSFDQIIKEPGVYYNPDEGVIIRVSRVSPLMYEQEQLVEKKMLGKKGGVLSSVFYKIADDPGLNDEEVEAIIREKQL
ncbi:MAG: hypothetical protein K6T91_10905 [Firmicutes bacterium]|nr:hypothetical protein [Bacillota bacterium]